MLDSLSWVAFGVWPLACLVFFLGVALLGAVACPPSPRRRGLRIAVGVVSFLLLVLVAAGLWIDRLEALEDEDVVIYGTYAEAETTSPVDRNTLALTGV